MREWDGGFESMQGRVAIRRETYGLATGHVQWATLLLDLEEFFITLALSLPNAQPPLPKEPSVTF